MNRSESPACKSRDGWLNGTIRKRGEFDGTNDARWMRMCSDTPTGPIIGRVDRAPAERRWRAGHPVRGGCVSAAPQRARYDQLSTPRRTIECGNKRVYEPR